MDPERRSLVATALVGLVVLAIIVGSIYYLFQFIRNRQAGNVVTNQTQTALPSPIGSAPVVVTQSVQPQQQQPNAGDFKTYNAGDFQITYPKNWGLLTCRNSGNVELDPNNPADQLNVECSIATKPITIIKNAVGCAGGELVDIGQVKADKSKATDGGYTRFEWCVKTVPPLYVTHRVSNDGSPATSREDFSRQVEEMISRLSFVQGS